MDSSISRPPQMDLSAFKRALRSAIRDNVADQLASRNLTRLISDFQDHELQELAACLRRSRQTAYINLSRELVQLQCERIRRAAGSGQPVTALYFPTNAYRHTVGQVRTRLQAIGQRVLTLIGQVTEDTWELDSDVYFAGWWGGNEIAQQLDCVDMFIFPHVAWHLPARAQRVYFPHDMHDCLDWTLYSGHGNFSEERLIAWVQSVDYVLVPLRYDLQRIEALVSGAKIRAGLNKRVTLIPGGYPRLDQNVAYFEAHPQPANCIIYAITIPQLAAVDAARDAAHRLFVIQSLLDDFPDYTVIFRPHPHTTHTPEMQAVAARFAGHPRFEFDDAANSYMVNYSRSAVMVTDVSGTAYTYALSTLRPVVFTHSDESLVGLYQPGFKYVADRERVGYIVHKPEQLSACVQQALENQAAWRELIHTYRASILCRLGDAEAYFVANVGHILSGRIHPDWIYA